MPSKIEEYVGCTDYALFQHLSKNENEWARRIAERRPYKVVFELHSTANDNRPERMKEVLSEEGIDVIHANSTARVSKYHSASPEEKSFSIYVVDQYDKMSAPYPIEESTQIFQKYEEIRRIERLYVAPENVLNAEKIIVDRKL